LSEIAGFVEYPILINEFEAKTIIIHPKHNIEDVEKSLKGQIDGYKLQQLNYNYFRQHTRNGKYRIPLTPS